MFSDKECSHKMKKELYSPSRDMSYEKLKNIRCRMCHHFDYHCVDCRKRCHKKCEGHSHGCSKSGKVRRTSSASGRLLTDELHWTKKLQANEFEPIRPCNLHCIRRYPKQVSSTFQKAASSNQHSSILHAQTKEVDQSAGSSTLNIPILNVVNSDGNSATAFPKSSPEKSVIHALFNKFIDWIESSKLNNEAKTKPTSTSKASRPNTLHINEIGNRHQVSSSSPSSAISMTEGSSCGSDWVSSREGAYSVPADRSSTISGIYPWINSNLSSSESDGTSVFGSGFPSPQSDCESNARAFRKENVICDGKNNNVWTRKNNRRSSRVSSTCSSLTAATSCTSPATSECCSTCRPIYSQQSVNKDQILGHQFDANLDISSLSKEQQTTNILSSLQLKEKLDDAKEVEVKNRSYRSNSLISYQGSIDISPLTDLMQDIRRLRKKKAFLVKTGSKDSTDTHVADSHVADISKIVINTDEMTSSKDSILSTEAHLIETLLEWNIEYSDIKIKERIREGVAYNIYRGRWHGDVLVNLFHENDESVVEAFIEEVTKLAKIRHENICLFMGASFNRDNLAIVTSDLKGTSVYERLHLGQERLPSRTRVLILRQVALAVGYLHAKGVCAGSLNSRNVYFEPKVKLSLVDQAVPQFCRKYELCFARGQLTYLAPEVLRQFKINKNPFFKSNNNFSFHVDIFAFGTLLYELMCGQLPFKGQTAFEIIYRLGSGGRETVKHLNCNNFLKVLTTRCWSQNPKSRPLINEINKDLLMKSGLHKRHSSSQPDQINCQHNQDQQQSQPTFNFLNYKKQISQQ